MHGLIRLIGAVVAATPLAAQGFTGSVQMRFAKDTLPALSLTLATRGEKWHATVTDDDKHTVVHMTVFNGADRTSMERSYVSGRPPAGPTEGFQKPEPLDPPLSVALTSLGKQRKIDGLECTDHEFEVLDQTLQGCFTKALGHFFVPTIRAAPRMTADGKSVWTYAFPLWAQALSENEIFPLKVWDAKQNVLMEVRRVDDGKLPECFGKLPGSLFSAGAGARGTTSTQVTVMGGRGGSAAGGARGAVGGFRPTVTLPEGCPSVKSDKVPEGNN